MAANVGLFVLPAVLLTAPLILRLAAKQDKKTKRSLRQIYTLILISQLLVGFLGWESAPLAGRSGFALAYERPASFLWLVFLIVIVQIVLLTQRRGSAALIVVILSFANSFVIFASMIAVSAAIGRQIFSLASLGETFLILTGNVAGLLLVNRDANLLSKYAWGKHQKK